MLVTFATKNWQICYDEILTRNTGYLILDSNHSYNPVAGDLHKDCNINSATKTSCSTPKIYYNTPQEKHEVPHLSMPTLPSIQHETKKDMTR